MRKPTNLQRLNADPNLQEMIRRGTKLPGVEDLVRVYRQFNDVITRSRPYTIRNGRVITISSSNRTE